MCEDKEREPCRKNYGKNGPNSLFYLGNCSSGDQWRCKPQSMPEPSAPKRQRKLVTIDCCFACPYHEFDNQEELELMGKSICWVKDPRRNINSYKENTFLIKGVDTNKGFPSFCQLLDAPSL